MKERLIEIVNELYAALPRMDWDSYRAHLHADFRVVETPALPYPGTFHGMAGLLELIGKVFELFEVFEATPGPMCIGEDHVMVWVEMKMTGRKSGKTINTQLIEVFKFEGEKLLEIWPFYYDTELIASIVE